MTDDANKHLKRVLRGGAWNFSEAGLRSAIRSGGRPDFRYGRVGFRLAPVPTNSESDGNPVGDEVAFSPLVPASRHAPARRRAGV